MSGQIVDTSLVLAPNSATLTARRRRSRPAKRRERSGRTSRTARRERRRRALAKLIGPSRCGSYAIDFVVDQLVDGLRFRALVIDDDFTQVPGAHGMDLALRPAARPRTQWHHRRSRRAVLRPQRQRHLTDIAVNPTLAGRVPSGTTSRPANPRQYGFVESLSGRLRDERLNERMFRSRPAAGGSMNGDSTTTFTGRMRASGASSRTSLQSEPARANARTESCYGRGQIWGNVGRRNA